MFRTTHERELNGSAWSVVRAQPVEFDGEEFVCFTNSYGLDCHPVEEGGATESSEEEESENREDPQPEDPPSEAGLEQEYVDEFGSAEREVEAEWFRHSESPSELYPKAEDEPEFGPVAEG